MNPNPNNDWQAAMRSRTYEPRSPFQDVAYWRTAFLIQRRKFPATCRGSHPYQSARLRNAQPLRLPA